MATRIVPPLAPFAGRVGDTFETRQKAASGPRAATLRVRDRYVSKSNDQAMFVESGVGVAVKDGGAEALSARDFLLGRAQRLQSRPESGLTLALWFQSIIKGATDPETGAPLSAFRRDVARSFDLTHVSFSQLVGRDDLLDADLHAYFSHPGRGAPAFATLREAMEEHLSGLRLFATFDQASLYVVGRASDDSVCGLVSRAPST